MPLKTSMRLATLPICLNRNLPPLLSIAIGCLPDTFERVPVSPIPWRKSVLLETISIHNSAIHANTLRRVKSSLVEPSLALAAAAAARWILASPLLPTRFPLLLR